MSGPWDPVKAALTDSRIAWLGATGYDTLHGKFDSLQLFWSPLATSPEQIKVNAGPILPLSPYPTGELTSFGDLAALPMAFDASGWTVVVANLITKKVWVIPARPGNHFQQVMAMNAKELLVQELTLPKGSQKVERIVRFDLSKLDELAGGGQ
ncbi:MAG: hypothetical protein HY744_09825 [Deltaproteobacteria bacterium]|nr:hypothetical protein [Deltaproteobacteria bacterium]